MQIKQLMSMLTLAANEPQSTKAILNKIEFITIHIVNGLLFELSCG